MFLETVQEKLWALLFLPLFSLCGFRLLIRSRLFPLRRFGRILRMTVGSGEEGGGITASQAACTALAATVGTGNIIGTAQAVAMGGPGALFWLWIAAVLGMMIKYAEILHGLTDRGGAMGYISRTLGALPARWYSPPLPTD